MKSLKKIGIIMLVALALMGCSNSNPTITGTYEYTRGDEKTRYIFDRNGTYSVLWLDNNGAVTDTGTYEYIDGSIFAIYSYDYGSILMVKKGNHFFFTNDMVAAKNIEKSDMTKYKRK